MDSLSSITKYTENNMLFSTRSINVPPVDNIFDAMRMQIAQ